jgi:hypothetical protein
MTLEAESVNGSPVDSFFTDDTKISDKKRQEDFTDVSSLLAPSREFFVLNEE